MFSQIEEVEKRLSTLEYELSKPEIIQQQSLYRKYRKEHVSLLPIVETFRKYKATQEKIQETRSLLHDPDAEMRELAHAEIESLKQTLARLEEEMGALLVPKDPRDEKDVILEIRAGTGGEEAALFAADLFRMYGHYIEGNSVFSSLKYESGVHRVQRVPETEAQGRIHTSAVTVAVLPEAEEVDVAIDPADLRVDVFRSSGPGGQSVNTTDSAVRITHVPTGLVVTCQDEKSQHKNKAKAMKVLRSRLMDMEQMEQQSKISQERKNMVGSGDRSERIRTYNFPQGRITDHRIGLTIYRLEDVLQGELDLILQPIFAHFKAESERDQATQLS
jgi:peptide chain release factor 1